VDASKWNFFSLVRVSWLGEAYLVWRNVVDRDAVDL